MNNKFETRLISAVVVLGFIATLLFVLAHYDVSLKEVALVLVGILAGKFGTVVDYFLGSSSGSARKDEAITKLTGTP